MNDKAKDAIARAMDLAQRHMKRDGDITVAVVNDHEYVTEWYWRQPDRQWEEEVVGKEGQASCGTFVTNVITAEDDDMQWRTPHEAFGEFETELLFGLTWDVTDGFEAARCIFTRDGGPELNVLAFAEIEIYKGDVQLHGDTPGFQLMRRLLPQ